MSTRPIVFVDTETTGLSSTARAWEIAVIRREPDGTQREYVGQIAYTLADMAKMRASEQALAVGGWLTRGAPRTTYLGENGEQKSFRWRDERDAALDLARGYFADEPVLVGVGVHFDAEILRGLFGRAGVSATWHYGLVDLKAATWGVLATRTAVGVAEEAEVAASALPLRSEALAAAVGVEPPSGAERHTALGDARWAARWFDALTGGVS